MSDSATPQEVPAQPRGDAVRAATEANKQDALKTLLNEMQDAGKSLGPKDAALQSAIQRLIDQAEDPQRLQQPGFRTGVAYALQDLEKAIGRTLAMPAALRTEMRERAVTSPGLTNPRMQTLMHATPDLHDRALVQDIRYNAERIARQGPAQDTPHIGERIDVLENRARLSRTPHVTSPAGGRSGNSMEDAATRDAASSTPRSAEARSAGAASNQQLPEADDQRPNKPGLPHKQGAVGDIIRAIRIPVPNQTARFSPPPAAVAERISLFEHRLAEGRTDQLIRATERAGVAAVAAAEQFITGPGRGILGKMEAAASTEPGGMQAVLHEMQPGGRYANLRTEFDHAYQQDRIFAGVYDKMIEASAQFGKDRMAVNANFATRNLDSTQLDGRFQRAEEVLGEAASKTPGRTPGKSALDEMSEKLAEILQTAVERLRTLFRKDASAEASQQARPSPRMSM